MKDLQIKMRLDIRIPFPKLLRRNLFLEETTIQETLSVEVTMTTQDLLSKIEGRITEQRNRKNSIGKLEYPNKIQCPVNSSTKIELWLTLKDNLLDSFNKVNQNQETPLTTGMSNKEENILS